MSKLRYAVCAYFCVCLFDTANANNSFPTIDAITQSKRDAERFSILSKELENERNLLIKNKERLSKSSNAKLPSEEISLLNLNIKRNEANIESLNKELGLSKIATSKNTTNVVQNNANNGFSSIPSASKEKPLPEIAPPINSYIQPTLNIPSKNNNPKFYSITAYRKINKSRLTAFEQAQYNSPPY